MQLIRKRKKKLLECRGRHITYATKLIFIILQLYITLYHLCTCIHFSEGPILIKVFKVPYIFQAIGTAVKIYISWLLFTAKNKQTNPCFGDPLKLIFLHTLTCLHCRTDYNNVQPFLINLDFDTTCMELLYTNNVINILSCLSFTYMYDHQQ